MLVNTKELLSPALEFLDKQSQITIDLETTGLQPYHGDQMIGIAAHASGESFYFPYRHHARAVDGENLPLDTLRHFRPLLSKPNVTYTFWNAKFDLQFLARDGVPLPALAEDVMLAAHLLNEDEPSFALKRVGDKYLGYNASEAEAELIKKLRAIGGGKGDIWRLSAEEVAPYAEQDARMTSELREFYLTPLARWDAEPHRLLRIWRGINQYMLAITRMEMRGLKLDVPTIEIYNRQALEMAEHFEARLRSLAGYNINPRSSKQLQALTGLPSTAVAILRRVSEQQRALHQYSQPEEDFPELNEEERYIGSLGDVADNILSYRAWAKASNTYYKPFMALRDGEDVLHPNLNIHGTVSGRMSCNKPNLQAVPVKTDVYKVKDVFVSRPGHVLMSADYSQAEMRLGVHHTLGLCRQLGIENPGVERMHQMLLRGDDIHQGTADLMHVDRNTAKRINFGVLYGIGAPGLSNKMNIPFPVAQRHLKRYHSVYPEFKLLYAVMQGRARKQHYINMWTGRQRHYRGYPEHKAMSNLIQGGVAEIMRVAITELDRRLPQYGAHMLHQIHDDIIFEIPKEEFAGAAPVIREVMTSPDLFPFDPPVQVDIKSGYRWGDLSKKMSEWVPDAEENAVVR